MPTDPNHLRALLRKDMKLPLEADTGRMTCSNVETCLRNASSFGGKTSPGIGMNRCTKENPGALKHRGKFLTVRR